ncbi:MAG TPA: M1 family metallopeptidase [Allosphingosinicella sp.]|jgi:aminopeptidase N
MSTKSVASLILVAAIATAAEAAEPAYDVTHFAVMLKPDFASRSIEGTTRITVRTTAGGADRFQFSDNGLLLEQVEVNGRPATVTRKGSALIVSLKRPLRAGRTAKLSFRYRGTPRRGIVFGAGTAYSNYFTCDWMICDIDRPGDKATLTLDLVLPAGKASIASGIRARKTAAGPGLERHRWVQDRPYSAYLFGFAAGFDRRTATRHKDVELVAAGDLPAGEMARRLQDTDAMLDFFREKAGLPFPHRRYVQVVVPGGEAQEKSSFSLLGRSILDQRLEDPEEDWLIAHELAHQYWGNLVTCESWADFWLNEGITTFMVAAWKEHRWGRAAYDREMELARTRVERVRKGGLDVPLTYGGEYPSLGARRAITYSKGALFMDALRRELGEEAFWAGLKRYTRQFAGKTATSRDFQRVYRAASGRDLTALFEQWVY